MVETTPTPDNLYRVPADPVADKDDALFDRVRAEFSLLSLGEQNGLLARLVDAICEERAHLMKVLREEVQAIDSAQKELHDILTRGVGH